MPIFRIIIIIVYATQLFGQTTSIILGEKDTLSVNQYDEIQEQINAQLNSENDIGKYFILKEINSDSTISYAELNEKVKLDTIIFINEEINLAVQKQIFKSIEKTLPLQNTQRQFKIIKNSYPYLKNMVNPSFGLYQKNKIGMILDAQPNFNNYFSGLIGAYRSDEQKWEVTGQLESHLENTWKTAGIIDLFWKRLDNESQILNLKYEEPHPFTLPIGISLQYSQDLRAGNYVHSNSAVGVVKSVPGIGKLSFGGKTTTINTTSKGDSLGLTDLEAQSIFMNGLMDFRNDYWLPTVGYFLDINGEIGSRTSSDSSSIRYAIAGEFEKYFPIFKNTTLLTKIYGGGTWLNKGNLHDGELIRYGGASKLRGYVEDIFQAAWVIIPSFEMGYNFGRQQRLSLFSDLAIQAELKPLPSGFGIGFSQVNENSVIRLYYGVGRDNSIKSGKIHLQFLTII